MICLQPLEFWSKQQPGLGRIATLLSTGTRPHARSKQQPGLGRIATNSLFFLIAEARSKQQPGLGRIATVGRLPAPLNCGVETAARFR